MGADCYICYSTNGDFCFRAQTRIREAVAAAALLGTKPERVIFLGYGDTLNHTGHPHLYDVDVPAAAPSGHTETYGAGAIRTMQHSAEGIQVPIHARHFVQMSQPL